MISAALTLAALAGCSDNSGTSPATIDPSGKHAANSVQQHWIDYKQANGGSAEVSALTGCSECHGSDLAGGISKVSCFSATFNGMYCHANDDHTLGHPLSWGDPSGSGFHGSAGASFNGAPVQGNLNLSSSSSCGLCHVTDSNVAIAGAAPSCLSTDPKWGIACHVSSPAAHSTGCVSCHGSTPDGTLAPNRAGAHAKHTALAGVSCDSCHGGYGSGTQKHATGNGSAFVKLDTAYRAEIGSMSYSLGKCAAVSCHGGKQTPDWNGGALNSAVDCVACHELGSAPQSPQYNSFYSGNIVGRNEHQSHLAMIVPGTARLIVCTDCHNLASLTGLTHFGGLATPAFETAPGTTVGGGSSMIGSYDRTTGSCNNSCHTIAPNPVRWNL